MSDINNGGPAFPVPLNPGQPWQGMAPCDGMSLRDYFAAKAMQGELSAMQDPEGDVCGVPLDATDETMQRLARHYYRLADAMLKARAALPEMKG